MLKFFIHEPGANVKVTAPFSSPEIEAVIVRKLHTKYQVPISKSVTLPVHHSNTPSYSFLKNYSNTKVKAYHPPLHHRNLSS